MVTAKQSKADKVAAASAALADVVKNPKIDLTPVRKEARTATFTGTLTAFGLMTFPVKTFKATDADSVSFNQVHTCADGKVSQLKQGSNTCSCCGSTVEKSAMQKGFKVGDKFIVVTQAEIDAQKPAKEENMSLTEFIDATDIDPVFYESTEFIAPDKGGEKPFALLLAGMKQTGKVAKGVRVKGGREQTFVVRPYGQHGLAMSFLFADYEVRSFDKWAAVNVSGEEVELAATLIERYEAKFTPAKEDRFLSNVRRMLEAKSAGVAVPTPEVAAVPSTTVDLMAALKASLAAAPASKKAAAGK
jgi:DNA end-binding protein Ku